MSHKIQSLADPKHLGNIDQVLLALETLQHDLPIGELAHIRSFNYTYLVITRNVRQAIRRGVFQYPAFIGTFDGRFAHYYIRAVAAYLRGEATPPAWAAAFRVAQEQPATPLVAMSLGVNAHVNNDIAQVLADCHAGPEHYSDYVTVNDIISSSIYEVLDALEDSKGFAKIVGPKQKLMRPAYRAAMTLLIKYWRYQAWDTYQKLRQQKIAVPDLESWAVRHCYYLKKLPV